MNRRSFLKILGGAATAAVAAPLLPPAPKIVTPASAPLFVPPARLDFGVPRRIVTATELPPLDAADFWDQVEPMIAQRIGERMSMLLLQSEFMTQYGGKLAAGSEVLVDPVTAERWLQNGIAVPGHSAPQDVQARDAARVARMRGTWPRPYAAPFAPIEGWSRWDDVPTDDSAMNQLLRSRFTGTRERMASWEPL